MLSQFVEGLDFESYVDDAEVRAALEAVRRTHAVPTVADLPCAPRTMHHVSYTHRASRPVLISRPIPHAPCPGPAVPFPIYHVPC
jgi:hypothetical protein